MRTEGDGVETGLLDAGEPERHSDSSVSLKPGGRAEARGSRASHYPVLDGLRGIAALAVMVMHAGVLFGPKIAAHSYLAVDFFFWLSGFVVARAYEDKLSAGMSLSRFAAIRLGRLYPMLIVGVMIGAAYMVLRTIAHVGAPASATATAMLLNVAILPVFLQPFIVAYPTNGNLWSLFYELTLNFAYAAAVKARAAWTLPTAFIMGALALIGVAASRGSIDFGVVAASFWIAAPRAVVGLAGGALLYRCASHVQGLPRLPFWLGALVLVGVFTALKATAAADLLCILLVFPVLTVLSAYPVDSRSLTRVYAHLGELSYPLYVLHAPIFMWLTTVFTVSHLKTTLPPAALAPVACLIAVAVSWVVLLVYDEPVRRLIQKRWLRRA